MCELFGVSSAEKISVNDLLREFFSHSLLHPNGWGIAVFYENSVSLEKEPIQASKSLYLRERLHHPMEVRHMIAHIRKATVGTMDYENCHPFVRRDHSGRTWTLAHNGTIFDYPTLNPYLYQQEGKTDSERILCYLVDEINRHQKALKRPLNEQERFDLLEKLISDMAGRNKLNLLIYDSELMYVHTNYANSLYADQREGAIIFSTTPLDHGDWQPVPFTTLCAYKDGDLYLTGTAHGKEYVDNAEDMKYIYADYAGL